MPVFKTIFCAHLRIKEEERIANGLWNVKILYPLVENQEKFVSKMVIVVVEIVSQIMIVAKNMRRPPPLPPRPRPLPLHLPPLRQVLR